VSLAQLEMHGTVSANDTAGHRIGIRFNGTCVTLDSHSTEAALAALSAMRHSRANGTLAAIAPMARLGLSRFGDFELELQIRGLTVARAGHNASPTWLGRTLTRLPIEMHWTDLLRVVLHLY